jgi:hypothetical protein
MSQNSPAFSTSVGARLRAALTDNQIQVLFDVIAQAGHLQGKDDQLRAIDPDLADTLRRILFEPMTQSAAGPSSQKTIEIWNDLWSSWVDHIAEVGEEEGRYVNQDEHWHPPYFHQGALADDLDKVAVQLSKWIDAAFPLVGEPDLFLQSMEELRTNIKSYPEWFQTFDEDFCLGPQASFCLLRWTWLGLANEPESGHKTVDFLVAWEAADQHIDLDRDGCCNFFAGLPEAAGREIHAYLREPQFDEKLSDLRSVWHRVQHEFKRRFDPAAHLQVCAENVYRDWHYGEPLIADGVSRQDFVAAERFLEQTWSTLLRWSGKDPWRPEKMLVPEFDYYRTSEETVAILKLLAQWGEIAARLGKIERGASLTLQRTVLDSPEDWSVIIDAFAEYQRQLTNPSEARPLFVEWQDRMASVCVPQDSRDKRPADTWTHRLIESQRDPASQEAFLEFLEIWLECCGDHVAFFQNNWRSLALLTRHLPHHGEFQAKCATFHSHVLLPALRMRTRIELTSGRFGNDTFIPSCHPQEGAATTQNPLFG